MEESTMSQRAKALYALQRIDSKLARKKARYREVQERLGEDGELKEARAALEAAEEELAHWRSQLRDRELEAAGIGEKIRVTEEKLYGGSVTNPKELSDLQQEGEYLKRRQESVEEKQLEEMMTVERLTERVAVANEHFTVVEAVRRSENAELSAEYDELRADLTGLLAKRKAVLKHISQRDLAEYDAIRRLRRGVAVVAAKNDMCQVCHVRVPYHDLERARDTDELMYCSGCERILYVPTE
jgi:predicted  nucleic acid-binding Zn-ribbon protein